MRVLLSLLLFLSVSPASASEESPERTDRSWLLLRRDQGPRVQLWEQRNQQSVLPLRPTDSATDRLLREAVVGSGVPNDRAGGGVP